MKQTSSRRVSRLARAILVDLALLGIFLVTFAYFHHVRVTRYETRALAVPTPALNASASPAGTASAAPTASADANETPAPTSASVDTGLLGGKYAEKFTDGEVLSTADSYRSANISVELTQVAAGSEKRPVVYYVADIYVKDISSFRTAMAFDFEAQNEGDRKNVMSTVQLSQLTNAVVAISGDNFTFRKSGLVAVRNGAEWVNSLPLEDDICVLYYDGVMETFPASTKRDELDAIYARNPYQIWTFGPQLLVDGQVPARFSTSKDNPLSAVGYYEPGHYCFILVDGRQPDYSWGLSLAGLAEVFYNLGCKVAYNLDGGDTAVLTFGGEQRSRPENNNPRQTSDILYIGEPASAAAQPQP